MEVGIAHAADRQHTNQQQHQQLVVELQFIQPQQQPHDAEEHPAAQQQTDTRRNTAEVEHAGAVLVAELMEEVHQDPVQRKPVFVPVPCDEIVGFEVVQAGQHRIADEVARRTGHRRHDRGCQQTNLLAAALQSALPVRLIAAVQRHDQQHRRCQTKRRMEYHKLLDAVHASHRRNKAGQQPLQGAVLFVGSQAAQHKRQHQHIEEGIYQIVPAIDSINQIMLPEGPEQRADHPEAGPPKACAFDKEQHGCREQRQRDGHTECAGQMPIIGEKQQTQSVEPLQVDDLQFSRVEPVVADDRAFAVQQVRKDHLGCQIGIHDPPARHKLIPKIRQVCCGHPQPRQALPQLMQHPALCLLFHAVSPKSDMFS